ncbi:MAG: thiolase domain-containing protein [Planctomycetes bacterium]|nr:thiolase domain-containing protein [Planctomycetota bacterium]
MSRVACIGAGMTRFVRRAEETPGELTARAVEMALQDAGLTIHDIDAVCLGTAPDAFDGIHMNGENLIAGAGAAGKPYMRHYVGGGTGVLSPIHGWMHVASGKFKTCLVVAEEKMSPCVPHPAGAFLTIFDHTTEQPLELTLIHIFAIEMSRFMHVYGYTEEEIALVSVNNKRNALDHPAAQIPQAITVADVMNSKLLSWPVKRLDISPTSDGAAAIVLANEQVARTHCKAPVFIDGVGFRLDTAYWCTRDLGYPTYVAQAARDAYKMAGITQPEDQIDVWEPYDPFDYKALHHMNALLQDKTGRKVRELLLSGAFTRDGSHPLCPSGGALGVGNPIAATGLMKIAELYFQLSGQAGKRQVKRPAHRGVAQAWGDLMQVGTVVVMSSDGAMPNRKTRWSGMKSKDLAGTALKDVKDVPHIDYSPELTYSWDNGYALTTYLDGFKKGKIRASQCSQCNRMMIPARDFCEKCQLQVVSDYFDLPDTGTVETFTLSHVNWASLPLPEGQVKIFAVVSIDGATDQMGLCHWLDEVDPKDVKIGMRVKAVWKPEAEREGTVTDLRYFRPIKPEEEKAIGVPVPIKPCEITSVSARAFAGKIPLDYAYTAGLGGRRFYEDLARGKLSGTRCRECEVVVVPPAAFCETCMQALDPNQDAVELDPEAGQVVAVTQVFEDRKGHLLDTPVYIAQVTFEGAEGSVFGRLDVKNPEDVEIGMRVKLAASKKVGPEHVVFKPAP